MSATPIFPQRDPQVQAIAQALAAPFHPKDVKFKPQVVKNNRCLAMAYIDARVIQDRLDEVLGVENWQDHYEFLPDGSVVCRLRLKFGKRWITKADVGSPSDQPDSGDRVKAAVSDALKRAAVKFGIGRYLYRLPAEWVDYDPIKKQIIQPPRLPDSVVPQSEPAHAPVTTPNQQRPASPAEKRAAKSLPATGAEFVRRLQEHDARLAAANLCAPGALIDHVTNEGRKAGFLQELSQWDGPAIAFAVEVVKSFEHAARSRSGLKTASAA
jgi:hypothetical protein